MVNSMCSIELMITNTSGKDYNQMYPSGEITAYDDEGNQYIRYVVVDPTGRSSDDVYRMNLPADIPVKYTLQIRDIKEEATLLRRVDWGNLFRLYDIPLVRD